MSYEKVCYFQRDVWSEMAREVRANFHSNGVKTRSGGGSCSSAAAATAANATAQAAARVANASHSGLHNRRRMSSPSERSDGGHVDGGFSSGFSHTPLDLVDNPTSPFSGHPASYHGGDPYGPMSVNFGVSASHTEHINHIHVIVMRT